MAKKVTAYIKLQVGAGKANPSPPVGPALGANAIGIVGIGKTTGGVVGDGIAVDDAPLIFPIYDHLEFVVLRGGFGTGAGIQIEGEAVLDVVAIATAIRIVRIVGIGDKTNRWRVAEHDRSGIPQAISVGIGVPGAFLHHAMDDAEGQEATGRKQEQQEKR